MARFDWYSCTLVNDLPPTGIVEALLDGMEGGHGAELSKGRGGYSQALLVKTSDGDTIATVLAGGNGNPHVIGSGENAPAVAKVMRDSFPAHRVTRLDSCEDLDADFAALHPAMRQFAALHGLKGRTVMPDDPEDGATYYIGAESSPNRVRCYQKDRQLAALGLPVPPNLLGIVRMEAQIRPVRAGRELAATLTPLQAWGASPWLRGFHMQFIGEDPGRVELQTRTNTSFERRCNVVVDQWGAHLSAWAHRAGGWEQLGRQLRDRISGPPDGA
jgi:hypothetical protein